MVQFRELNQQGGMYIVPPINDYKCNKCGYSLQSGWGGYMYIINDRSGK